MQIILKYLRHVSAIYSGQMATVSESVSSDRPKLAQF
jgi:hypothetical protein